MNLLFLNIGIPEILILTFGVVPLILTIYCVVDILKSNFKDNATKLLWLLIVLVAPLLGSIIYLAVGRSNKVVAS